MALVFAVAHPKRNNYQTSYYCSHNGSNNRTVVLFIVEVAVSLINGAETGIVTTSELTMLINTVLIEAHWTCLLLLV